ncbi:MAG TPA: glycosyltransferase family 39 protein, partial [Vicinamibacterales bacterium]
MGNTVGHQRRRQRTVRLVRRVDRATGQPGDAASAPSAPAGDDSPRLFSLERWLGARQRGVLLAIVIASIGIRIAALVQITGSSLADLQQWDQTDMHYYDGWARAIAGGDWLSRSVGVPMHAWHIDVADAHLKAHPNDRAPLETEALRTGRTVETQLWTRWNGEHTFYEDPLYAYLVAATYKVVGAHPLAVLAWQLCLGVLTNVAIVLVARRCFGSAVVGALAGLMAVLAAPLVHYELLLLRDSTIVFATVGLVWLTTKCLDVDGWAWPAALGAALGLSVLLKGTFLLVALGTAVAFLLRSRGLRGSGLAGLAAFAIALSPAVIRNVTVGAPGFALAGGGAPTFIASNVPDYPASGGLHVDATEVADVLGTSGDRLWPAVGATLR